MAAQAYALRDGGPQDAAAIRAILNREITNGVATWRDEPMNEDGVAAWIATRSGPRCALLAAEAEGALLGFAAYGPFRPLGGYRWTVETSIYLEPRAQGMGVGGALLSALIARARTDGLHAMVALIGTENAGSIAFHRRHGFVERGRMPELGRKFGRWLDLALLQLSLEERA